MIGDIEHSLREVGFHKIGGVDECGRGSLISFVCVGYVMLPANHHIEGIRDSKKLSRRQREKLSQLIYERALEIHISRISNTVIDQINILNATKRGVLEVLSGLKIDPDVVIIDGKFPFSGGEKILYPYICRPKADNESENAAAASIIAKTHRDNFILQLHEEYPMYGWNKNFGYGTAEHIQAIKEYGVTPYHRKSFSVKGISLGV